MLCQGCVQVQTVLARSTLVRHHRPSQIDIAQCLHGTVAAQGFVGILVLGIVFLFPDVFRHDEGSRLGYIFTHICRVLLASKQTGSDWENPRGDLARSARHGLGNVQTSFGGRDGRAPREFGRRRVLSTVLLLRFCVRRNLSCVGVGVPCSESLPYLVALFLCTAGTEMFFGFHQPRIELYFFMEHAGFCVSERSNLCPPVLDSGVFQAASCALWCW